MNAWSLPVTTAVSSTTHRKLPKVWRVTEDKHADLCDVGCSTNLSLGFSWPQFPKATLRKCLLRLTLQIQKLRLRKSKFKVVVNPELEPETSLDFISLNTVCKIYIYKWFEQFSQLRVIMLYVYKHYFHNGLLVFFWIKRPISTEENFERNRNTFRLVLISLLVTSGIS